MSHLGRWLSALVDGELDGSERDHVLNHVAGCRSCRQEANAMRALKRRLVALGETSAEPVIASRLIELALFDRSAASGGAAWPTATGLAHLGRAGSWSHRLLARSWRLATAAAGGSLIAIGVVAFLLGKGGTAPPVPRVTPSVDSFMIQHTFDAGQEPGSVPATGQPPAFAGHVPGQVSHRQETPGLSATQVRSRSLARPAGQTSTGVNGAGAGSAGQPIASPTASAHASPSQPSHASPHLTSPHPG